MFKDLLLFATGAWFGFLMVGIWFHFEGDWGALTGGFMALVVLWIIRGITNVK